MKRQLLLTVSALSLISGAVLAGDTEETSSEADYQDLEEIVVVGQKSEKALQEITTSVSVQTGEIIEREPLVDLSDVVLRVPNVTSSFGRNGFAIRGVDQRGVGGGGSGLTLTIYVDDAPLGNQTTFFGPLGSWDLQQVEVYRGPQSTNFGRNTLAGAIYVRTKDPEYEWSGKARAEIGNNGQYWGALAVGGPIIQDKLAFRVAADYREADGFLRNTFLEADADPTELWNTRFKLRFDPTDNFSIISTSSYTENFGGENLMSAFSGGAPGDILDPGDLVREVQTDVQGLEGTETFIQSVNATWDINENWSIQSITAYQTTDYTRIEDFDRSPAPIAALDRTGDDEALTEEFRIRYAGGRLNLAMGFYYADVSDGFNDSFIVPASIIDPALPPSILIQRGGTTGGSAENIAGFFDAEYALSDTVDLLFGARYDYEENASNQSTVTTILTPLPPQLEFLRAFEGVDQQETQADFSAFLPKAGLRWRASNNATVSFVVQRAYRAGGAEVNFVDGSLNEFAPEYLWNYELGLRTSFLDGSLIWNTNIYYSDWTDQQVTVPLEPPFDRFSQTVNAGQSELYGLESELTYRVSETLNVYGSVGYASAQFIDFANGNFDPNQPESIGNPANFAGNSFPFAPEFSFNGGFDYRNSSGLFGGVDVSYQSEAFNSIFNAELNQHNARALVNARLGYQLTEQVALTGYVRNLFDADYFTQLARAFPGEDVAVLGDQLTWAIRLDYRF